MEYRGRREETAYMGGIAGKILLGSGSGELEIGPAPSAHEPGFHRGVFVGAVIVERQMYVETAAIVGRPFSL